MRAIGRIFITFTVAACGGGGEEAVDSGPSDPIDAAPLASSCAPGEFAVGFDLNGQLRCKPIDEAAAATLSAHCSFYFGWSDACNGCTTVPTKWGEVSGDACALGVGANNTCTTADLGGVTLPLFGLNLDGNADDNDTFHIGFECTPPEDEPLAGACAPGSFMSALDGSNPECVTAQGAIAATLEAGCQVYFGWNDNCNGCTSAPAKWGRANSNECVVGAGANNTCNSFRLGDDAVFTLGVNLDGDVNGDDTFYVGFQCNGASEATSSQARACPAGQLVVGVDASGVSCASPALAAQTAVQTGCYLYAGWRDSCNGCETPPAKWGRVSQTSCENGVGVDNVCISSPLEGTSIQLLGLNTDGDVGDDDKFYLGLSCP